MSFIQLEFTFRPCHMTDYHVKMFRGVFILLMIMEMGRSQEMNSTTATSPINSTSACPEQSMVVAQTRIFTSPGYPADYTDSLDCRWNLRAPTNKRLRVAFSFMDVEYYESCSHDSITFYDGPDESYTCLGQFCGTDLPGAFETSGRYLLMVFHTDDSVNAEGFELLVSRQNGPYTPTTSQNTTAATGNSTTTAATTSPNTTSWSTSTATGDYTTTNPCSVQALEITQPTIITSPGYPANYANNLDCIWNLTAPANMLLRVSFSNMNLENHNSCNFDSISFYDGTVDASNLLDSFCGRVLPGDVVSGRQSMWIVFHTDYSVTSSGFSLVVSLEYEDYTTTSTEAATSRTTRWSNTTTSWSGWMTAGPGLQERRVGNAALLSSPNYPSANYGHNQDLSWTFTASPNEIVSVYFIEFEMEGSMPGCPFDSVILYDGESQDSEEIGTFCDHYVQTSETMITSTGPTIFLEYSTDGSISGRGFSLLFVPIGNGEGSQNTEGNGEGCIYVPTAMYANTPGMVVWCDHHCALGYCPASHCLQVC